MLLLLVFVERYYSTAFNGAGFELRFPEFKSQLYHQETALTVQAVSLFCAQIPDLKMEIIVSRIV